jgi:hypothetical protein
MKKVVLALLLILACVAAGGQQRAKTKSRMPRPAAGSSALTPIRFEDITRQAGIQFSLRCGSLEKRYIMEAMCGGIGFIDYDVDGWPDIVLLNGSSLDAPKGVNAVKVFHNNHDLTFTDVTDKLGIRASGWGMGVAVADYNNDGYPDLYLTFLDHAVLLRNEKGQHFTDVTREAGVANEGRWGTSAAFGDFDNDGYADLYVANYVDLDLNALPEFGSTIFCQYRGIKVSCGPRGLKGSRDRLYHNNRDGTFTDITEQAGIDPGSFYGLGVVWLDYDNDGCQDIYVADDSSPSLLYKGDCKGNFASVGLEAGVAFSADGLTQAGMGVDAADFDRDGLLDLTKTNFSDDTNNLYRNMGNGEFTDINGPSGFGPVSTPFLGFGVKFADFDNDGWPDVMVVNGHVNPQVDGHGFGVTYKERNLLFRNLQNGKFEEIGKNAGAWLQVARVGRGLAVGDINNDGELDLLISNLDSEPVLALNRSGSSNRALTLELISARGNRIPLGTRVTLTSESLSQIEDVRTSSSYLSASDHRLHFGLGNDSGPVKITIRWVSGEVETYTDVPSSGIVVVQEGKGIISRRPHDLRRPTKFHKTFKPVL